MFAEKLAGLVLRHEAQDGFEQKAQVALLYGFAELVEGGGEFVWLREMACGRRGVDSSVPSA